MRTESINVHISLYLSLSSCTYSAESVQAKDSRETQQVTKYAVVVVLYLRPGRFGSCLYIHDDLTWGMGYVQALERGRFLCVQPLSRGIPCLPPLHTRGKR